MWRRFSLPIGIFSCQSNESMNKHLKRAIKQCKSGSRVRDPKQNMYCQLLAKLSDASFTYWKKYISPRKKQRCTICFQGDGSRKCTGCTKCKTGDTFLLIAEHTRKDDKVCCPHNKDYAPRWRENDWRLDNAYGSKAQPIILTDDCEIEEEIE